MGLHGTALLIGGALSAPIAGAIIDAHGPAWAFVVAGLRGGGDGAGRAAVLAAAAAPAGGSPARPRRAVVA